MRAAVAAASGDLPLRARRFDVHYSIHLPTHKPPRQHCIASTLKTTSMNHHITTARNTVSIALPPAEITCSYRSKPCQNVRATKLNGEFHKLCEYHRRRANLNQQRVHQRRKLREFSEQQAQSRSSITESLSDIELDFDLDLECEPSRSPCGDLPLPDLEILELLLLSDAFNSSSGECVSTMQDAAASMCM